MNEQNIPQSNEPVQSSKHIWITIIAVVITAIIVGGGVYAWQKSSLQSTEQSLQQQITDLQNQIVNLQKSTQPTLTSPEITEEPTQPIVTTPEETQAPIQPVDETANWKTYSGLFNFTLKYPPTLKVSCPAEPSCFLGSLQLGDQYYSADTIPVGTVVINLGSYGVESDQTVTDLYQWRKNWSNGLNTSAAYKETTVNGRKALEERTAKDITVYILTGTGRVLAFMLFPLNSTNEKLFNSILGTITITK